MVNQRTAITTSEMAKALARALKHGLAQITNRNDEAKCFVVVDVLMTGVIVKQGGEDRVVSFEEIHQVVEVTGFGADQKPILGRTLYQAPTEQKLFQFRRR